MNAKPTMGFVEAIKTCYAKYFNFNGLNGKQEVYLLLGMIPQGIEGQIDVYIDRPWTQQGGKCVGSLKITPDMPQTSAEQPIKVEILVTNDRAVGIVYNWVDVVFEGVRLF